MTKKKSTALAQLTGKDLLPEDVDYDELVENLEEMDDIEFPRIRFRQGKFFFSDEDAGVEEFDGVLLYYGKQNTYWAGNYDSNNIVPPECFSPDGKEGSKPRNEDGEFGDCKTCKFNQFGSGVGKGKACRNQIKLYIQRLGTTVPMTLFLAPTSIGSFQTNYLMNKVTQKGLSYAKVVTRFKAYQKGTETYYRVSFDVVGSFKDEHLEKVKELRTFWLPKIKEDRTRMESMDDGSDDHSSGSGGSSRSSNDRVVKPRETAPVSSSSDVIDDDDEDPPF